MAVGGAEVGDGKGLLGRLRKEEVADRRMNDVCEAFELLQCRGRSSPPPCEETPSQTGRPRAIIPAFMKGLEDMDELPFVQTIKAYGHGVEFLDHGNRT